MSFGLVSSLFDFATFAFLLFIAHATDAAFQTGWFIESLLTELAIVLIVRTHKTFWASRPSPLLAWLTLGMSAVVAIIIPYLPFAAWFGFVPLPLPVLAGLVAITALYLLASEATKRWFFGHESRQSHRKRAGQLIDRGPKPHAAYPRSIGRVGRPEAMMKRSAGILPYRRSTKGLQGLLVHPAAHSGKAAILAPGPSPRASMTKASCQKPRRGANSQEETGWGPKGAMLNLGELRQRKSKIITVFALEGDFDTATLRSNMFEMEWPRRSGRVQSFPEVDRGEWLDLDLAREKLLAGQRPFLDRLVASVARSASFLELKGWQGAAC